MTAADRQRPIARRLGRPPQTESAQTRANIVAAARWCFARHGYDKTSNRLIADRAGITTGAIYHYFDSKQSLFGTVANEMIERIFDELDDAVADHSSFAARVAAALERSRELHHSDESLARFVAVYPLELERNPELARYLHPDCQRRSEEFFLRLATDGVESGDVHPSLTPTAVGKMLSAIMVGMASFAAVRGDAAGHAEAIEAAQRLFTGTLLVSPGTVRSDPSTVVDAR